MTRHARSLFTTAQGAIRWFAPNFPDAEYFRFFLTAAVFNLGRYIFVLLYNLYLLRAGFRENILGSVASAMTAGSLAGTWIAAETIRRAGVRRMLLIAFPLIAGVSILQALATSPAALVVLAFAAGLVSSTWAVGMSPAVAERTSERNRAFDSAFCFHRGSASASSADSSGGDCRGGSPAEAPLQVCRRIGEHCSSAPRLF